MTSNGNRLPSSVSGGASAQQTPARQENAWSSSGSTQARRSSGGSDMGRFSGLIMQKRGGADAGGAAARKASFDDQKPPAGFVGQMWNSLVKGSGPSGAGGTK
ncbi:MAG: hypothetical protein M1832_003284 [Thelocarpon impressellum]|nr:MAG: hypothetical protein M1832_003284 [Thelocarpon impressellum]